MAMHLLSAQINEGPSDIASTCLERKEQITLSIQKSNTSRDIPNLHPYDWRLRTALNAGQSINRYVLRLSYISTLRINNFPS